MKWIISILALLFVFESNAQGKFFGGAGSGGGASESLLIQSLYVEYGFIRAQKTQEGVKLLWQTVTEHNNDYFEIQRLNENDHFNVLATIKGHGTTNEINNYQWVDNAPYNGDNFYRIRQVDYDGTEDLSRLISVSYLDSNMELFPNPAQDHIYLSAIPNQQTLSISDVDGRICKTIKYESRRIPIDDLTKGLYILSLNLSNKRVFKKFIVE